METYIERALLSKDEVSALQHSLRELRSKNLFRLIPQGIYEAEKSVVEHCVHLGKIANLVHSKLLELESSVSSLRLDKIWHVESTSKSSHVGKLPYLLHFDKARYLKAMIYLSDVGDGDGAICVGTASPETFEARRRKLPEGYKEYQLNSVAPEEAGCVIEMTGSAGDCIYFDTNTPHKAGILHTGHMREVLRLDFVHPIDEGFLRKVCSKFNCVLNQGFRIK